MKWKWTIIASLFLTAALTWRCANNSSVEGTVIRGQISSAENMQVFFDKIILNKASSVLGKADIDNNGKFELAFPEGLEAGVYNLRIGIQKFNLAIDGSEGLIEITGDLNDIRSQNLAVSGARDAAALSDVFQKLMAGQFTPEDMDRFVDTTANAFTAAYTAYRAMPLDAQALQSIPTADLESYLPTHEKALNKLRAAAPNAESVAGYEQYLNIAKGQIAARKATELVQVGQPAPDIRLPNPNGKEYALSDLKGKVVLLDFWASWCGPCRRENPNVVKVYDKYKDQGFTVFSVSLDGLDERFQQRYTPEQFEQQLAQRKQRWIDAIKQDNLSWEYHVSDLKYWSSAPAQVYGVSSIPRAFIIDREGNIVNTNVRGAAAIEQAIQGLL